MLPDRSEPRRLLSRRYLRRRTLFKTVPSSPRTRKSSTSATSPPTCVKLVTTLASSRSERPGWPRRMTKSTLRGRRLWPLSRLLRRRLVVWTLTWMRVTRLPRTRSVVWPLLTVRLVQRDSTPVWLPTNNQTRPMSSVCLLSVCLIDWPRLLKVTGTCPSLGRSGCCLVRERVVRLTGDRCTLLKGWLRKFGLVFFHFVCTMIRYIPSLWIFTASGHSLHINRVLTMNENWHKTAYKPPIARKSMGI